MPRTFAGAGKKREEIDQKEELQIKKRLYERGVIQNKTRRIKKTH